MKDWGIALTIAGAFMLSATGAMAEISDNVVKIGVLGDQAGFGADLSGAGAVLAARMAAQDFGGAVLGKPIEIVFADHQNKADVGASIMRRWIDTDKVDAVTDLSFSSVSLAAMEVGKEKNRTVLVTGGTAGVISRQACSPVSTHWADDTVSLAANSAKALVQAGGDTWYFIAADAVFGATMQADAANVINAGGGKVVGSTKFPSGSSDFSSQVLQAQASKAKVIATASGGGDTINIIKQSHEFGLAKQGQNIAAMLLFISDVHALGLNVAQGLYVTTGFYWDQNDATRAWSKRFAETHKKMPTKVHGSTYAAVMHYLQAVKAAGTDEAVAVNRKMRELPVDFFGQKSTMYPNGRVAYDMGLYQVKSPAESKAPWDYYKQLRTVPAAEAFPKGGYGECKL
jgi:branched-chain amino acid transport system substrate-binding protein